MIGWPRIIAFVGKGGAGKSIMSALTGKIAIKKNMRVLFVDADPTMGLATALALNDFKTLGEARERIIQSAKGSLKSESLSELNDSIDYALMEVLSEQRDFGVLVMGQTNSIGCYCPINTLLRGAIKVIAKGFDLVIIDAEAGIEQINRQVIETVHFPVIITDNSMRGVKTALLVQDTMAKSEGMHPVETGVIFNKTEQIDPALASLLQDRGLPILGCVGSDKSITELDRKGENALTLEPTSLALAALEEILVKLGIFD